MNRWNYFEDSWVASNGLLNWLLHSYSLDSAATDNTWNSSPTASNVTWDTSDYKLWTACWDFNGSSSNILLGSDVRSASEMTDFTIAYWIKLDSLAAAGRAFDFEAHIIWQYNTNGSIEFRIYNSWSYTTATTAAWTVTTWVRYHVVHTRNSTQSETLIDWVSKATYSSAHSPWFDSFSRQWRIGSYYSNGSSTNINGRIDEFHVYNRALSWTEIAALPTLTYADFTS